MLDIVLTLLQYEALHRVHLIPSEDAPAEDSSIVNANVFRDLDSKVSEGGDNFSTGSVCHSTCNHVDRSSQSNTVKNNYCAWHEQS
jgi:hypothetical protein